jgi:C-terminal processing protease CtpA/Prc
LDGCTLTILRDEQELTIEQKKTSSPQKDSRQFYMISPEIGYVNVGQLKTTADVLKIMDCIENIPATIFDLRNYPLSSNYLIFCFLTSNLQLTSGQQNFVQDLSHCGAYYINEAILQCPDDKIIDCSKKYKGKIVALIYANTMSAPENMALLFRSYGATLIGMPTAGAHGNIALLPMPGGIVASFSAIGYFLANGDVIQRQGVIPDIEVYPTIESIKEGKDEILEEAINYININNILINDTSSKRE